MLKLATQSNAQEHNIEGYLYSFNRQESYYPAWKKQMLINNLRVEELKKLGAAFLSNKIDVYLLKGFSMLGDLYQDLGSRFASDVDLLVDSAQLDKVSEILLSEGYTEIPAIKWMGDNFKYTFEKNIGTIDVTIELHTRLFWHQKIDIEEGSTSHIRGFKKLSNEEQFVHLAGHFAFQHTCLKLFWLVDILKLSSSQSLDIKKVMVLAKKYKVERSVVLCLNLVNRYGVVLSKKNTLPLSLQDRLLNYLVNDSFLQSPDKNKLKYYLIKNLLKDSFFYSLKYNYFWLKHKIKMSFVNRPFIQVWE